MNTISKAVFVAAILTASLAPVHPTVAQSIEYSGQLCVGSSIDLYIRGSLSCGDLSVPGMSSWQFSQPPTTITYPNLSRYDRVRVTWNYPVSGMQVSVSYNCAQTGTGGTAMLTGLLVNASVAPSVSINVPTAPICRGSSIQLVAGPTLGGSSPGFEFRVDGITVYSGPASSYAYQAGALSAGTHTAQVIMNSSAVCATPRIVSSTTTPFTIQEKADYSVTTLGPTLICAAQQSVVIKSNVIGTTGNLTYEWFVNGAVSSGGNSKTVDVNEGTQVYCKVYSDQWCVNSPKQASNIYTLHLTPSITPTASIKVTKLNWCPGETMLLSASNSEGGGLFNWTLNGNSISTSSSVAIPIAASATAGAFYPGSLVAVRISAINGTCLTKNYADATLGPTITINTPPVPTFTEGPLTICQGSTAKYVTQSGMSDYRWTTSGGATILADGSLTSNSITVAWPAAGNGSITVSYRSSNGCMASVPTVRLVIIVTKPTVADAGPDQTGTATCGQTAIALRANASSPPITGVGQWSVQSGANGIITTPGSAITTFTGTPGTSYVLRWMITNGVCGSTYDEMNVLLNNPPGMAAAGADLTGAATCGLTSITLSGNAPPSGSGKWNIVTGTGGSLSDPANPKSIFKGLQGESYTLKWVISTPHCGSTSDQVAVKFNLLPTPAAAGTDIAGTATCGLTSVILSATEPVSGSGLWSVLSSIDGSFDTPNKYNSVFRGNAGASYQLRWTVSRPPCVSADDVLVQLTKGPTPANAGPDRVDATTCGLTTLSLSANTPAVGLGQWKLNSGDGGAIASLSSPASSFTGTPGNTYKLTWTVTQAPCPPSFDEVIIKLNQSSEKAIAGADIAGTATCGLTAVTLNGNVPTKGAGTWSVFNGAGGSFNGNTNPRAVFSGTPSTPYTLRWTVSNLPCPASYDDVNVFLNAKPSTTPSATGNARFGAGQLSLSASGAAAGESYQWLNLSGQVQSTSQTFRTPVVSASVNNYIKLAVIGVNSCVGGSVPINLSIYALPVIQADKDNVMMGDPAILTVGAYDSYRWTTETGALISTQSQLRTRRPGIYTVTVTRTGAEGISSPLRLKGQFADSVANTIATNRIVVKGIVEPSKISELPVDTVAQSVQYLDGLGRPIQSVITQSSPSRSDFVTLIGYDGLGRETRKYLPFTYKSDGQYKGFLLGAEGAPGGQLATFYNTPDDKIADDVAPFSESVFEKSPLMRIKQQGATGISWQPQSGRSVSLAERTNLANEVLLFGYDAASGLLSLDLSTSGRFYSANQLLVMATMDEDKRETLVFADKAGKIICKKIKAAAQIYASTYYIYDKLGNLVVVLPPEAIRDESVSLQSRVNAWGFQYRYDSHRRMISKKVPGADSVLMVYDSRDRLVLSQDGNERAARRWSFTKYDELDRVILTGMLDTVQLSQSEMQKVVNSFYKKPDVSWGEQKGLAIHGYTNRTYPVIGDANKYLTATWYDDYTYMQALTDPARLGYLMEIPGEQEAAFNPIAIRRVTGTKVKVLDGGPWGGSRFICAATYYDEKLRPVQIVADNLKGGTDRTSFVLDFVGKILTSKTTHRAFLQNSASSPTLVTRTITRRITYDLAGRVTTMRHKLDNNPEVILSAIEYNEIGQAVRKNVHSTDGNHFLQYIDQSYNVRGWVTGMNGSDNSSTGGAAPQDLFGYDLYYNKLNSQLGNTPLYSGNIGAMTWTNDLALSATKAHGYVYEYDTMGRISSANFKTYGTIWQDNTQFDESGYSYDRNGNITRLKRNGSNGLPMDNLAYDYGSGAARSNQLLKVNDGGDKFRGFVDGNTLGQDYAYDANGNLVADKNKNIGITYNFLNLPERVARGSNSIQYIYDATGRKLCTVADYSSNQTRTDYVGDFVYENDVLQSVSHEEGRIAMASHHVTYQNEGDFVEGISATAVSATLSSLNGNQSYIKAASTSTVPLREIAFGPFPVTAGEQYVVRIKGYHTGGTSTAAKVIVKINNIDYGSPGSALPGGQVSECWIEQSIVVPQNAIDMRFGLRWTGTAVPGETFYVNHVELVQVLTSDPEYQYNYKDHLGNVRMTFTSRHEVDASLATLEPSGERDEQSDFLRYNTARKVQSYLFDHTNGNAPSTIPGYAERLNGSPDERVGLAKSLSVMPGDTIEMEVFAKYVDANHNQWSTALATLMGYVLAPLTAPGGTIIDGGGYSGNGQTLPPWATAGTGNTTGGMKAGLSYIMFDRNMMPLFDAQQTNVVRLSDAPREYGQDGKHEKLYARIIAKQAGFLYVYLANDSDTPVEVYFDDFKVEHRKGPVVQIDEYYPLGERFNHYLSENSLINNRLYNAGSNLQDQLDLNVYETQFRTYDPVLGRWWQVDPKPDDGDQESLSTYQYSLDNPIRYNDPNGDCPPCDLTPLFSADAAVRPNGVGAHLLGFGQGVSNSLSGLVRTLGHPIETAQGLGNLALAGMVQGNLAMTMQLDHALGTSSTGATIGIASALASGANNLIKGNGQQRGQVLGEVAGAFVGSKGLGLSLRATGSAMRAAATAEGFLIGSLSVKAPFNIPVQRFGAMSIQQQSAFALRTGSSPFLARTFNAILPQWNNLTNYTLGTIPKGTGIRIGFTAPQGLKHPGGFLQINVEPRLVTNQTTKLLN
jgi:RHS repeat-associated protein